MSSDFAQGAYFQPSSQENQKTRSSRKRVYKYTDSEFAVDLPLPATERYRPPENRFNINDFSFEDRSDKLRTPKKEVAQPIKLEDNFSPITAKDSNKKKEFDLRINKIENLNDKISNLLKMVPRGSNQTQERASYQTQERSSYQTQERSSYQTQERLNKIIITPQQTQNQFIPTQLPPNEYTPYRQIQEETKRNRRTEQRKKNFSYLEELNNIKQDKKVENQEERSQQEQKYIDEEQESSPITKYRNENQEQNLKQAKQEQVKEPQQPQQPQISQSILKVNNESERKVSDVRYRYTNSSRLQKYREEGKTTKQKQNKTKRQKQKQSEKKQQILQRNAQLDAKINQLKNRIIEDSPIRLKNYNDALSRQYSITDHYREIDSINDQPTLSIMAGKLSLLVDLDIIQRKLRQSFEQYRNDKKWEVLRSELKARNIYLEQSQLKQLIKISIHQKNPFGDKVEAFPLNGAKDLAKIFAQTDRIWKEELDKFISLDDLARQKFQMGLIDLNRKGYISIEDLVCFINVHGQRFYRSRDLAQLFRRFLAIQGKTLEKNIGDGVDYRTFMGKIMK